MKIVAILFLTILSHLAVSQKCIDIQLVNATNYVNSTDDIVYHISTNANGDFELKTTESINIKRDKKLVFVIDEANFSAYYHIEIAQTSEIHQMEINTVYQSCQTAPQVRLMIGENKIQSVNLIIE